MSIDDGQHAWRIALKANERYFPYMSIRDDREGPFDRDAVITRGQNQRGIVGVIV